MVAALGPILAPVLAQTAPTTTQVAALIDRELKAARVPGASYAIVIGNDVLARSYGVADAEQRTPMTADTLMHVGSLNKLMTALAVVSTLDARGIPLTVPVGKYLPGAIPRFPRQRSTSCCRSPPRLRDKPGADGLADEAALAAGVRAISAADFLLPRGVVFSYSNLGYAAAGAALEQLQEKAFADALRDAVFAPLGMKSTTLRPAEAAHRALSVGHRADPAGIAALRTPDNDTSLWPAGYLWSNATDMARVLTAVMGRPTTNASIQRAVACVTSPQVPMPNVFVGGHYGYGLMLGTDRGVRVYEHGGTQTGFSSLLRVAPDRQFGVIIMTNLDNAPLRRIAPTVMAEALQLPPPSSSRSESAVGVGEVKALMGVYRNRLTAEIAERDGQVVLMLDGSAPMAVSRIGENRYLARPKPDIAGPEFVLQPATASSPAYLHFGLWAHTR